MGRLPEVIVVNEDKEIIEKMKNKLARQQEKYEKINDIGIILTNVATPGLAASLLSPFDIEGPIVEVICGIALIAGITMKSIAKNRLDRINAIKTDGTSEYKELNLSVDEKDKKNLLEVIEKIKCQRQTKGYGR
jgi:hypothetical protein